jgi:hypothetical protein
MERNETAGGDQTERGGGPEVPEKTEGKQEKAGKSKTRPVFLLSFLPSLLAASRPTRGVVLVWTALLLFILVGILGLSLDWEQSRVECPPAHNAADAGRVGGALVVKTDEAQARQWRS